MAALKAAVSGSVTRRRFASGMAGAAAMLAAGEAWGVSAQSDSPQRGELRKSSPQGSRQDAFSLVAAVDRARILREAKLALAEEPVTVTASHSPRSAGGLHDYFSEGDYWWPDPKNLKGPYIRRDGFSNPANFVAHRSALIRFSMLAPALAAAWRLTRDKRYAEHCVKHLRAWFMDAATKMNPNLNYAQAISGITTGRGIGVIDTLQLVDVARGVRVLEATQGISPADAAAVRAWFAAYVDWMATSKNGKDEERQKNNHGTCWVLQVAEFAPLARRPDLTALCVERFKNAIVPDQIAANGSLPLELARTKPYSYSLFDADVLSGICQSLSTPGDDLWRFKGVKGADVGDVVGFLFPFIADKAKWPFPKDVEYFDDLPSRRPCLLFAGEALDKPGYVALWRRLDANPTVAEIIRNLPIRQPLLWVDPLVTG